MKMFEESIQAKVKETEKVVFVKDGYVKCKTKGIKGKKIEKSQFFYRKRQKQLANSVLQLMKSEKERKRLEEIDQEARRRVFVELKAKDDYLRGHRM